MTFRDRQVKSDATLLDQTNILPRPQLLLVFTTLSITLLICYLDQNGITVTLPTIASELHGEDSISWAGTASLIANTAFQMLYGRLSDIFGRKVVYLGAVTLLIVADLLCGLSQSSAMFYVFRGVAGIGGGGIANLSMIIVSDIVTLDQRGKYQGIIGAMVGLGNIAGPFLAAALVARASWRAFFYTIAPMAAAVWLMSFFLLPKSLPTTGLRDGLRKIDYAGSLTSSVAVIFILIPISGGGSYFAWESPMIIAMLAIGCCAFALFVYIECRVARLPMMPIEIFKNPVVTVMLAQSFLFGAVYQSYLYYLPLYLQNAHQFSQLVSAAICCSLVSAQTILSVLSGQYMARYKKYGEVIWLGFGVWTLGSGLTLVYGKNTNPGIITLPLILIGIGVGCIFQPTLVAFQAHTPKSNRAVIISNRNFFRSAGGACGLAASAAVLQASLRENLPTKYLDLSSKTYSLPNDLPVADRPAVLDAYMAASRAVFILQIPLIGLCLLGCFLIQDRGLEYPGDKIIDPATPAFELGAGECGRTQVAVTGGTRGPRADVPLDESDLIEVEMPSNIGEKKAITTVVRRWGLI